MVDTWNDTGGTETKLGIARRQIARATEDAQRANERLKKWQEYVHALEQVMQLEHDLGLEQSVPPPPPMHANGANHGWSLVDLMLVFLASHPKGETTPVETQEWLAQGGFYKDKQASRGGVNSTYSHRKDLFQRLKRGRYTLTEKGKELSRGLAAQSEDVPRLMGASLGHDVTRLFPS